MLSRIRKAMEEKDEGFTLIELLVVIIIIGILAAIAIPVFLSQKKKGVDASIKSDLNTASTVEETYVTDHPSTGYQAFTWDGSGAVVPGPVSLGGDATAQFRGTAGNVITATVLPSGNYKVVGTNAQSSVATGWVYCSGQGGLQPKGTLSTVCT